MNLFYNDKTGKWEERKEPFSVVEFPTEEDYNVFLDMLEFWKERHQNDEDKKKKLTPCDVCRYNPPSSFGGKPCTMCPADSILE